MGPKKISRLPSPKQMGIALEVKIKNYFMQAERIGIEAGWLWLYHNGFAHRVPKEARDKIAEYEEGGFHVFS